MTSTMMIQACAKCSKGGSIATCNGCQQPFCIRHFVEHRQELTQQLDDIGQEHDLLQRDMNCEQNTSTLLACINQWEKESIKTIQSSARKARLELQQFFDQTKNELKTSLQRLTEELRTCRETDDYTEIDIKKWAEKMKEVRQMIENPSVINIECDKNPKLAIPLIKVTGLPRSLLPSNQEKRLNKIDNRTSQLYDASSSERFVEMHGNITLSADGLTGYCAGSRWDGSCLGGIGRYSSKMHRIHFRIEKKISSYFFFGITNAAQELTARLLNVDSTYGWWELGFTVVNGKTKDTDQRKNIKSGDEVTLILDCDNRQIQLQYHPTNVLVNIPVDLERCPFPWKMVLRLDHEQDCIKIVH